MTGTRRAVRRLTDLELEVMRHVWAAEAPPTVRDVQDAMNASRDKPLAYNTVQTVLSILRDKGVVRALAGAGRAHRFRARLQRAEITASMVGDLVDRLGDGRARPLLVELLGHASIDRDELEDLQRRIRERLGREAGDAPPTDT